MIDKKQVIVFDIDRIKIYFGDFVKNLRKNKWLNAIIVTNIFKVNLSGQ